MIIHDWPSGLMVATFTPRRRSGVLGADDSLSGDDHVASGRDGRVGFDLTFADSRGAKARAWRALESALRDGVEAVRYRHCDPDRVGNAALGFAPGRRRWASGRTWASGRSWRIGMAFAALNAAAAEGDETVTIDTTAWSGGLEAGSWIGFGAVDGMHMIERIRYAGMVATCRIWPGVRNELAAGTLVTLHPTLVVTPVPRSGQWARGDLQAGQSVSFVEVPHARVRAEGETW